MSKLIDRLRKISQGEVHRMGFGSSQSGATKTPAIAMLVALPGPEAEMVEMALQAGVEGILIKMESLEKGSEKLEKVVRMAGDVPCGFALEASVPDDIRRLASLGADFLALHTETAPSTLLSCEEIGRVAIIDPYLDDSLLRSLDRLSVDAVLIELDQGDAEFFTVRDIMACRRAIDLVRKPVILQVSTSLSADDMSSIKDLGIESVLVSLGDSSSGTALSRLRQEVDKLPPRRRHRENADAILPQLGPSKALEPEDDEL